MIHDDKVHFETSYFALSDSQTSLHYTNVTKDVAYPLSSPDVTMDELYGWHDPAIGIERIYATNTAAILWSNMSHYSNPEVDALFRSASGEKDPDGRKALYGARQERLSR